MRISLYKKGIVLLAIPLSLQLLFAFWFAFTYSDVAASLKYQAARINAAVKASNVAVLTMMFAADASQFLNEVKTSRKSGFFSAVMASETELESALDELAEVGHPYQDLIAATRDIATLMKNYLSTTSNELMSHEDFAKTFDFTSYFRKHIVSTRKDLLKKVSSLSALPPSQSVLLFTKSNQVDVTIISALLICVFANIAASAALWVVIRRNVVANVSKLNENFTRLAHNQALLPPIEGSDEFADFDREFHGIAQELINARAERHQYLDIMSSSMREPLVDLEKFIDRLNKGDYMKLNERAGKLAEMTAQSTSRLVYMLNELIDYEQIEQGIFMLSLSATSAHRMIDDAISSVKAAADNKQISIHCQCAYDLELHADPDRLIRVLINLLTNAIKFSPNMSAITVKALHSADSTTFVVEDQGRGIPENMLTKIFERYQQVDQIADSKAQKGSGLGLAICKTIVDAHKGTIWAENHTGGARFCFSIPSNE
jgi:signal transduction histidine kinase